MRGSLAKRNGRRSRRSTRTRKSPPRWGKLRRLAQRAARPAIAAALRCGIKVSKMRIECALVAGEGARCCQPRKKSPNFFARQGNTVGAAGNSSQEPRIPAHEKGRGVACCNKRQLLTYRIGGQRPIERLLLAAPVRAFFRLPACVRPSPAPGCSFFCSGCSQATHRATLATAVCCAATESTVHPGASPNQQSLPRTRLERRGTPSDAPARRCGPGPSSDRPPRSRTRRTFEAPNCAWLRVPRTHEWHTMRSSCDGLALRLWGFVVWVQTLLRNDLQLQLRGRLPGKLVACQAFR